MPQLLLFTFLFSLTGLFLQIPSVYSQSASELQSKIDQRNLDIANLEKEIQGYQKQIDALGTQANSLSSTIKSLDLTQKKLSADIRLSEDKISAKTIEIQQLSQQIVGKEGDISDDKRIVTHSFTIVSQLGERSIPELLLSSGSFSEAWTSMDTLSDLQKSLYGRISALRNDKAALETNKQASERAKSDLVTLEKQLQSQRSIVLATTAEKNSLLKDTKQSESTYKKLLATKKAQKDAFEQEVLNYESQLRLSIDVSKLPHTGSGVLNWPLSNIKITQYFGNTAFSTANPQLYSGKGHTGVDFAASIGTPIHASLSGIVVGVANTDVVPTCQSFGKWIMVKHPNGLSTLYAHLSLQSVAVGDEVTTGQVIGYSGNTGYTTGPHLHFGVYATEGVQIKSFANSVNCRNAIIPVADFKAYLNPLSYL